VRYEYGEDGLPVRVDKQRLSEYSKNQLPIIRYLLTPDHRQQACALCSQGREQREAL